MTQYNQVAHNWATSLKTAKVGEIILVKVDGYNVPAEITRCGVRQIAFKLVHPEFFKWGADLEFIVLRSTGRPVSGSGHTLYADTCRISIGSSIWNCENQMDEYIAATQITKLRIETTSVFNDIGKLLLGEIKNNKSELFRLKVALNNYLTSYYSNKEVDNGQQE